MFGFGPGGMFGGFGASFEAHYRAMPVAFLEKHSAEHGDKVILPPSALERLASLHIEYPMLFKVENTGNGHTTHCGVLEFVAEEGVVYMPHWMMQNLLLEVGDMVKFKNVSLPKGQYVKLQPVTSDFLDISNPKAVLERTLRNYTCLTVGDCFVVNYNNKNFEIEVKQAKPGPAISVIETDCQVDFEAPKDYKEPEPVFRAGTAGAAAQAAAQAAAAAAAAGLSTAGTSAAAGKADGAAAAAPAADAEPEEPKFVAFVGSGRRLDGKPATAPSSSGAGGTQPVAVPAAKPGAGGSRGASVSSSPGLGTSSAAAAGSTKAGTFIGFGGAQAPPSASASTPAAAAGAAPPSTGNRLLDKLAREKAAALQPGAPKPSPPPVQDDKDKEAEKKFSAFQGKGYTLANK